MRYTAILGDKIARQGVVLLRLRDTETILLVEILDLQTRRKLPLASLNLSLDKLLHIVLVLNLAKYLLQNIFQRYDTRSATKLVDDNSDARLALGEGLKHSLQRHSLGDIYGLDKDIGDTLRVLEQRLRVDIADDIVDGVVPHEDTRIVGLDKALGELLDSGRLKVYGLDIDTLHHTISDTQIGKIQSVLEETNILLVLALHLDIVGLDKLCQVVTVELHLLIALLHTLSRKAQKQCAKKRCKARYRIENQVDNEDNGRKECIIKVWVMLEYRFWDILANEDDDHRR